MSILRLQGGAGSQSLVEKQDGARGGGEAGKNGQGWREPRGQIL